MRKKIIPLVAGFLSIAPVFADENPIAVSSSPANAATRYFVDPRSQEIRDLLDKGDVSAASRQANRWVNKDSKADEPWAFLAEISFNKKKYKKAISLGEKALSRNPRNPEAYYWRGRAYEAQKNWLEAANEFRAALISDPGYTHATEALNRVKQSLSLPQMDARKDGHDQNP